MKKIRFKKIIVENYGPFQDRIELFFKAKSFVFIFGPNGIGKTTLLNALMYCCYGVTSKKETGDDLVNNKSEKNLYVRTDLFVDDIEYKLERYHKHVQKRNIALVSRKKINGEWELVAKGSKETIPYIEKLICSKDVFSNTLFFAQGINVLFADLKDIFGKILNLILYTNYREETKNRKKSFEEEVVQISFDSEKKLALIEEKENRINFIENKEQSFIIEKKEKIDKLNLELNSIIVKQIELSDAIKNLDLDNPKELEKKIKELNDAIIINTQEINNTNKKIKDIETELTQKKLIKLSELTSGKEESLKKIEIKYKDIDKSIIETFNDQGQLLTKQNERVQKEITSLNNEKNVLKSKIENIKFNINEIKTNQKLEGISSCPTCDQEITEEVIEKINTKINNFEKEITENQQYILLKIEVELKKYLEEASELKDDLNTLVIEKNEKIKELLEFKKDEITKCELKLSVLKCKIEKMAKEQFDSAVEQIKIDEKKLKDIVETDIKTLTDIKNKMEELKQLYDELKEVTNNLKLKKEEIEKEEKSEFDKSEIEIIDKEIDVLNYEIESFTHKLYSLEYNINMSKFWMDGFSPSGIPNKLIDDSIPFMNKTVQGYMDQLSHGRYLVSFDTMSQTKKGEFRDKVSVNVVDTLNKTTQRKSLSGGQNRIIDVGIILTLRDLQNNINDISFNILMLDEILDSLDQENRKATIDILRKVLNSDESDLCINLISHTQLDFIERDVDVILNL